MLKDGIIAHTLQIPWLFCQKIQAQKSQENILMMSHDQGEVLGCVSLSYMNQTHLVLCVCACYVPVPPERRRVWNRNRLQTLMGTRFESDKFQLACDVTVYHKLDSRAH